MLFSQLHLHPVALALVLGLLVSSGRLTASLAGPPQDTSSDTEPAWVQEALGYTEQLSALATDASERNPSDLKERSWWQRPEPLYRNGEKADWLLWKLWLLTGLPPQRIQDRAEREYLRESVTAYQEYVSRHRDCSEEDIVRLGLANAVESIASPRWYATLHYLEKKASFRLVAPDGEKVHIDIQSDPHWEISEEPLSQESYCRLGDALQRWLRDNKDQMNWDSAARRFRPKESYRGSADLTAVFWVASAPEGCQTVPWAGRSGGE